MVSIQSYPERRCTADRMLRTLYETVGEHAALLDMPAQQPQLGSLLWVREEIADLVHLLDSEHKHSPEPVCDVPAHALNARADIPVEVPQVGASGSDERPWSDVEMARAAVRKCDEAMAQLRATIDDHQQAVSKHQQLADDNERVRRQLQVHRAQLGESLGVLVADCLLDGPS